MDTRTWRPWRGALAVALCVALAGCGDVDYKADIRSDTSWTATFDDRVVEGSGDRVIDIPDDHPSCCEVQKKTRDGWLSISITADGGGAFGTDGGIFGIYGGPDDSPRKGTLEWYGILRACSED